MRVISVCGRYALETRDWMDKHIQGKCIERGPKIKSQGVAAFKD